MTHLWYVPNEADAGHRGDEKTADHNSLDTLTEHARLIEDTGWDGALIGTGWGRPDTFTVATALAARTTTFRPLIAVRPGYWHPARFASAAATLDHLSGGRVLVNVVSGEDSPAAYGDQPVDRAARYARTGEFLRIVRKLWTEEDVTVTGEHYRVTGSTLAQRPAAPPPFFFGGASPEAERVAAAEADVQLFWGEPLDDVRDRIARLRRLSDEVGRRHAPLEFGLRVTTVVRDTSDEAWADAHARVDAMAAGTVARDKDWQAAVGQQRLLGLAERGEVLDGNLYTAPGRYGAAGAGTTWLVGSADEVARSLRRYQDLGIRHFILSDTPYRREVRRQGRNLLPLLRRSSAAAPAG
ncbi:LLM class flavin-dependent oxidoreductase [Cryptosporangium phraense]|uniref:LLM class flavin-dependent oxidoreductase n=1 Tax=Cryptosporangium phraense TaxID=2593070 RepID=A0A545ARU9_9ACTN|nr:LLM class flavin-dependent oxidoreductase [Cryptosporangium phraense]TQS44037.1 LLM class flavin-dependent oxidoreductase [Cryptosporangium phraense]